MKRTTLFAGLLFIIVSCSDFLNVNQNPNDPSAVDLSLNFPSTVIHIGENVGTFYQAVGCFWSQYWSQGNTCRYYEHFEKYDLSYEGYIKTQSNNTAWINIYTQSLNELQTNIESAERAERWDYYLMNTTLLSYVYQMLVDYYDAIPYFEALNSNTTYPNVYPKYDKGEDIYMDLLKRIDFALEKASAFSKVVVEGDLIFDGELKQWIAFSNTLKLKMLLRVVNVLPELSNNEIRKLSDQASYFLEEDAKIDIYQWDAFQNPMFYENFWEISCWSNIRISTTLFNYYDMNNDSRLQYIINPNFDLDTTISLSMPQGGFKVTEGYLRDNVEIFNIKAEDPVYLISEIESYLLQAEAIERGFLKGNAKELYELAIMKDFERKGIAIDADHYLLPGGVYAYPENESFEIKLEAIIMAKWAAFAGTQGAEAFFEQNRTGYPRLSEEPSWINGDYNERYVGGQLTYSLAGTTNGLFPKRLPYPPNEVERNLSLPEQAIITEPVWWVK